MGTHLPPPPLPFPAVRLPSWQSHTSQDLVRRPRWIFDEIGGLRCVCFPPLTQLTQELTIKAVEDRRTFINVPLSVILEAYEVISHKELIELLSSGLEAREPLGQVEAKWFVSGHIPKVGDYLKNGMVTSGIQVFLVHMFFVIGDGKSNEHARLISDNHAIISSVSTILRLWDDLGSAQDENQDGRDGSYIKYFLYEHEECSIKNALEHVLNLISDSWKCLNKECTSPNQFSYTFRKASINIANMVPLMYSYSDHSLLPLLIDYVKAVV
ncbi:(3S,6E)-nerolidol synthase 1 [Tanacetum coccineum]